MSVQIGDTVHVAGMSTSEGLYVKECEVLTVANGEVHLRSSRILKPKSAPRPSLELFTVPERYFDISLDDHLERLMGEAAWIRDQFKVLDKAASSRH